MKIITKRIDEMERATYNPRVDLMPGDEEFQYLEESMRRFGQVLPIVWNQRTNRVVSGHQRLSVLEYWGEEKAEVSVVDLDEIKEKQLNLALNKITGSWDNEKLKSVLEELGDDALGIGFSKAEIDALENDLAAALDADFLQEELSGIEETFNIELSFNKEEHEDVAAYIKANGKEGMVQLILKKIKGKSDGMQMRQPGNPVQSACAVRYLPGMLARVPVLFCAEKEQPERN